MSLRSDRSLDVAHMTWGSVLCQGTRISGPALNTAPRPRPGVPGPQATLLKVDFRALALGGEARDGPHLDFNACVKLLIPHVPHALDRGGDCFILQMARSLE